MDLLRRFGSKRNGERRAALTSKVETCRRQEKQVL
jgi:hypothetical protein